jgi:hypothetical protein
MARLIVWSSHPVTPYGEIVSMVVHRYREVDSLYYLSYGSEIANRGLLAKTDDTYLFIDGAKQRALHGGCWHWAKQPIFPEAETRRRAALLFENVRTKFALSLKQYQ